MLRDTFTLLRLPQQGAIEVAGALEASLLGIITLRQGVTDQPSLSLERPI